MPVVERLFLLFFYYRLNQRKIAVSIIPVVEVVEVVEVC